MGYNIHQVEVAVERICQAASVKPGQLLRPSAIAGRLFGQGCISYVQSPHYGRLIATRTGYRIEVQDRLPDAIEEWVIGHELGHYALGQGRTGEAVERTCDAIGAALQMRTGAYRSRLAQVGDDWQQLAIDFGVTETSAALRAAEVTGRSLAVVMDRRVYSRGKLARMTEERVRALAYGEWPGLHKARLSGNVERLFVDATKFFSVG